MVGIKLSDFRDFTPSDLYTKLQKHIETTNLQEQAVTITGQIQELIESHKNTLFFGCAAVYSSLGFPHMFCAGIPIGIAMSIGARHFSGDENPWYPLKNVSSESIGVLTTLGTLSLAGRVITILGVNFFNYTDGVLPSLAAGAMTGMMITSSILSGIDSIRQRII